MVLKQRSDYIIQGLKTPPGPFHHAKNGIHCTYLWPMRTHLPRLSLLPPAFIPRLFGLTYLQSPRHRDLSGLPRHARFPYASGFLGMDSLPSFYNSASL